MNTLIVATGTLETVINDIQMQRCNELFELGFDFSLLTPKGLVYLKKRAKIGIVTVCVNRLGLINGSIADLWYESYHSNISSMLRPSPISIILDKHFAK